MLDYKLLYTYDRGQNVLDISYYYFLDELCSSSNIKIQLETKYVPVWVGFIFSPEVKMLLLIDNFAGKCVLNSIKKGYHISKDNIIIEIVMQLVLHVIIEKCYITYYVSNITWMWLLFLTLPLVESLCEVFDYTVTKQSLAQYISI